MEKIAKSVQEVMRQGYGPESGNFFRASLFRHNFLKLRDQTGIGDNTILIYCWSWNITALNLSNDIQLSYLVGEFRPVSAEELRRNFLTSPRKRLRLPDAINADEQPNQFGPGGSLDILIKGTDGVTLKVSLVCHPTVIVEAQLCKLLQYMCTFDSRLFPLITLIRAWAKLNSKFLGETNLGYPGVRISSPAGLDWMVVFWMVSHEWVPPPRDVLKRPHSRLDVKILDDIVVDIGFAQDEKHVSSWKKRRHFVYKRVPEPGTNSYLGDVLSLAQSFFVEHAPRFSSGNKYLMNTRDAEWLKLNKFLTIDNDIHSRHDSKLTCSKFENIANKVFDSDNPVCSRTTRLHIVNPLTVLSSLDLNHCENEAELFEISRIMEDARNLEELSYVIQPSSGPQEKFNLIEHLKIL